MKKTLAALSTFLMTTVAGTTAMADLLSVHVDVPVSFSATGDGASNPDSFSGFKAGVSLFVLPLGVAYSNYTTEYEASSDPTESEHTYSTVELFVNLPVPVINIALGAGAGTVSSDIANGISVEDQAVTSYFASVGYPILPLVDVHVGYQVIDAQAADAEVAGAKVGEVDNSANVATLGVKVGF
jgi:hypothetical protein